LARGWQEKVYFFYEGRGDLWHYIEEYKEMVDWFRGLVRNKEEIWKKVWSEDLDEKKRRNITENMEGVKEKIVRKRESEKIKG